jgi:hypothetical protein
LEEHTATEFKLLPATFQDLRFGKKIVFLSEIDIGDGGEG